jgi:carboxypeptidase C (cathepsin A)
MRLSRAMAVAGFSLLATGVASAQQESAPSPKSPGAETEKETPKAETSVTEHSIQIGSKTIAYTATAGTLVLRDDEDQPEALFGYTAYVLKGVTDPRSRPITFAYNGGPGSSSFWLHMGALGPRRIVTTDAGPTPPPPYQIVDNDQSILDVSDLVMIDPVGTGFSHAVGKKENKDFWGTDPDIASVSQFIFQYVSDNERWNSPKFLLGESYGTTRSAGVVDYLSKEKGMAMNGVVLVSVALDLEAIFDWPGNERPFPFFVPTFAATAWYHEALRGRPVELEPFLDEVRAWAMGPYCDALAKGDRLPDDERTEVVSTLHRYTGLSEDYIRKANLRVSEPEFTHELLNDQRETVGRLDSRFTGFTFDQLGENAEYDPQSEAVSAAFTAAFLDYYHRDLGFGKDKTYHTSAEVFGSWDFKHRAPGSPFPIPMVNTGLDLAEAMGLNPNLRVLVLNGYYDLATPFLATEYMFAHLGLSPELASHVTMKYYRAGHMMYLHAESLAKMKSDVAAFITANVRN